VNLQSTVIVKDKQRSICTIGKINQGYTVNFNSLLLWLIYIGLYLFMIIFLMFLIHCYCGMFKYIM